jgi:hypothetical protein
MLTWAYFDAPESPESVTFDGVTYDRIERLPRNVRPGDLVELGDGTDPSGYHRAYVIVSDVATYPETTSGWRRHAPECHLTFKLRPEDNSWRWRSWGYTVKFYDQDTKERTMIYRARRAATSAA